MPRAERRGRGADRGARPAAARRLPGGPSALLVAPVLSLWIVGALCVKDVPMVPVVAIVNQPTYLPCDISSSLEGDAVELILWFREDRDGSSSSIYSIDARERDITLAERWSDENVFSNRAKFVQDKQPAELRIDRIREDEAGVYRCRVEFRLGQTRNSKVNLSVIVPPQNVTIHDEDGRRLGTRVGPFLEREDLRLFCDVHGGKPQPTVGWYRNGSPASRSRNLTVKNLGRQDVDAEFTCSASNNDRSPPLTTSVRLDMTFNPLTVRIEGKNEPLPAGEPCRLVCTTSGSRPPALVTWLKDNEVLPHTEESTSADGNTTSSILTFVPGKEDAGKQLYCRAENPIMRSGPIEDSWILQIQYTPETVVQLGSKLNRSAIKEGSDVYFDCHIQAEPPVYKVEWRHQGKNLNHNTQRGVIITNQSLVLQRVDRKNAGNYTCVGYNTLGDGESPPVYLNIMFTPTCKPNQTTIYGVAKQEKASITCEVDANPAEVDFGWTFNSSAESIDLGSSRVTSAGTSSVATYTPMIEMDYGTLLCWASNRIGRQQVPCVYRIIPAGRPDVVHNCTTSNTSKDSFVVRCSPGFNGGLNQSFMLEVRESNSQELKANLTSSQPHFSVSDLEAGSLYQACVYAYNDKGRSEPMVVQAGTLSPPEKQLTSDTERPRAHMKLTPMLSVMIGVVAALVIVAVIVMIVLRIQHSQVDEQTKPRTEEASKPAKAVPIQRELRFRECGSLITDEKHPDSSPFGKLDTISCGEVSESDEKNPDIIPQQITGEEVSEYLRKRRLVSTIETSPSRGLLERSAVGSRGGHYIGYCTIRSGMPMRDLSNAVGFKHKSFQPMAGEVYEGGMCTLPRQHWPSHHPPAGGGGPPAVNMSPTVMYAGAGVSLVRGPGHLCPKDAEHRAQQQQQQQQQQQHRQPVQTCCVMQSAPKEMHEVTSAAAALVAGKAGCPLLVTKRESSV